MASLPPLSNPSVGRRLVLAGSSSSPPSSSMAGSSEVNYSNLAAKTIASCGSRITKGQFSDSEEGRESPSILGKRKRREFESFPSTTVGQVLSSSSSDSRALISPAGGAGASSSGPLRLQMYEINSFLGTPPSSPKASSAAIVPKMPPVFKPVRAIVSPFAKAALKIMEEGFITKKDGSQVRISPIKGACGQHSQIYSLSQEIQLLETIANHNLIVKIFQEPVIMSKGDSVINSFLTTSLKQYQELRKAELPIVEIYNCETAKQDGYLLVEKVIPFSMPWNEKTSKEVLLRDHKSILDQIKVFIDYASKSLSSIPLDLNADNFGINREGRLVLLDFMEHEEDLDDPSVPGAAFNLIKSSCFEKISKGNLEVIAYITT